MKSGSGADPDDHNQEPLHGRENSSAATSPSDGAPPSATAAEGGTGASSSSPRSPRAAAPVARPQERVREQPGGGSRGGAHGSASAAAGVDRKGKGPAPIPLLEETSAPSSGDGSPFIPSPDAAWPFGAGTSGSSAAIDCRAVFERLVRDQRAINEATRQLADEDEEEQANPTKALWSKFKNFTRKIVDREGRQIYAEHVGHQTIPITEVGKYYRVTEDCVNLDAYLGFRPVFGDGECFYRSFIFSYLEQVLHRQDTHEEHRLLDTIKRLSTQHTNLGWTSEFRRSYKAFKKLIEKVMGWKRQGRWNSTASTNSYRKEKLLEFFSNYNTTKDIFVFLRLVAAIEICSHEDEYGQLIPGLNENYSLKDWCFLWVTPAREFTDHIMMTALARALDVPLKLEKLYGVGFAEDNIYTGPGLVSVTLLYTGNHYDIIYPRPPSPESSSQHAS